MLRTVDQSLVKCILLVFLSLLGFPQWPTAPKNSCLYLHQLTSYSSTTGWWTLWTEENTRWVFGSEKDMNVCVGTKIGAEIGWRHQSCHGQSRVGPLPHNCSEQHTSYGNGSHANSGSWNSYAVHHWFALPELQLAFGVWPSCWPRKLGLAGEKHFCASTLLALQWSWGCGVKKRRQCPDDIVPFAGDYHSQCSTGAELRRGEGWFCRRIPGPRAPRHYHLNCPQPTELPLCWWKVQPWLPQATEGRANGKLATASHVSGQETLWLFLTCNSIALPSILAHFSEC